MTTTMSTIQIVEWDSANNTFSVVEDVQDREVHRVRINWSGCTTEDQYRCRDIDTFELKIETSMCPNNWDLVDVLDQMVRPYDDNGKYVLASFPDWMSETERECEDISGCGVSEGVLKCKIVIK